MYVFLKKILRQREKILFSPYRAIAVNERHNLALTRYQYEIRKFQWREAIKRIVAKQSIKIGSYDSMSW